VHKVAGFGDDLMRLVNDAALLAQLLKNNLHFAKRCAASDESFFFGPNKAQLWEGVKELEATGWGEPAEGAGGAGRAGAGASEARSPWLDLLGVGVEDLKKAVSQAKVSSRIAVECCVSDDVWKRSILEWKGTNRWHILDEWAEVVIKSQPHTKAGGVAAEVACGLYRLPTEESITAGRERAQAELQTQMETQQHIVSPRRGEMRSKAAAAQAKQGREMQQRAKVKHGGAVAVGTLVQVAVDNVDRAKTDDTNATLVVVEVVQKGTKQVEDKYRLACASGTIKTLYTRSYIQPLPGVSPEVMGLQIALDSWRGMPEVGLREAMRVVSAVGGQGLVHCACKGECNNNRCACVKAKRKCNSRCHKGSTNCRNHD